MSRCGRVAGLASVAVALLAVLVGLGAGGHLGGFSPLAELAEALASLSGSPFLLGTLPILVRPADRAVAFSVADIPSLEGKTAVVTGANIGLGFHTALELARKGAKVVITCRSQAKCDTAAALINKAAAGAGGRAVPMVAELGSLASTLSFTQTLLAAHDKLHIIVLNAGIPGPAPQEFTEDGLDKAFQVNHLSHFLMYKRLEPALKRGAADGLVRVAVVSSAMAYAARTVPLSLDVLHDPAHYGADRFYAYTKMMNILFAGEVDHRLGSDGIANAAHPGGVASGIWRKEEDKLRGLLPAVMADRIAIPFLHQVEASLMWSSADGALTQLALATVVEEGGRMFHPIFRQVELNAVAANRTLARELWAFSERVLAEKGY